MVIVLMSFGVEIGASDTLTDLTLFYLNTKRERFF